MPIPGLTDAYQFVDWLKAEKFHIPEGQKILLRGDKGGMIKVEFPIEGETEKAIKGFVNAKVEAGYSDLFLFKNRSGQFVFQVYDSGSGNPTSLEVSYFMYGKPDPNGKSGIMPPLGKRGTISGMPIAGFQFSSGDIQADMEKAFELVTEPQ